MSDIPRRTTSGHAGVLFDIKRFALHDGPGIRTTAFFKGCPLSCTWCHNPESQSSSPELLHRLTLCVGCGACLPTCPQGAIRIVAGKAVTDRERCTACGACMPVCPHEARTIAGQPWTVDGLADELMRDAVFYEQSGGGITCSGGEPLQQAGFCAAVLRRCRQSGIHTAVDTCGYADTASLERVAEHTDLFLYDLKLMDDRRHREATGVSNDLVLRNLEQLDRWSRPTWIRVPLIPTINDDEENLLALAEFVRHLTCVEALQVLPYHTGGEAKWLALGRTGTGRTRIDAAASSAAADRAVRLLRQRLDIPVTEGG